MPNDVLKDMRIYQTTQSGGLGPLALTAQSGNRSFYSAFGHGGADVFLYLIRHRSCEEWEVGTGHLSDAATLVRDRVIASSNGDLPVDFSAGIKDITNNIHEGFYDT